MLFEMVIFMTNVLSSWSQACVWHWKWRPMLAIPMLLTVLSVPV